MTRQKSTEDSEKTIEERLKKLEKENRKIKQENKQFKREIENLKTNPKNNFGQTGSQKQDKKDISRREFLKKAGIGTAGLAALGLAPASALNINTDELSVNTGSDSDSLTENLTVDADGNIEMPNGNLDVSGNSIENVSGFSGSNSIIGVDELDTGISPTWTGEHTFESDIDLGDNDIRTVGNIYFDDEGTETFNFFTVNDQLRLRDRIRDTDIMRWDTDGRVIIEDSDLRLDTGQAIEDGNGSNRIEFLENQTRLRDSDENVGFEAHTDHGGYILKNNESQTRVVRDNYGNFNAVEYQPSNSPPGMLELSNANLLMNGNGIGRASINLNNGSARDSKSSGRTTVDNFYNILGMAHERDIFDIEVTANGEEVSGVDDMFDLHQSSRVNFGEDDLPVVVEITWSGSIHYMYEYGVHFNWQRSCTEIKVERYDSQDDEWVVMDEENDFPRTYEYRSRSGATSHNEGIRFTFDGDLHYEDDFRIGLLYSFHYYYEELNPIMTNRGGDFFGDINMNGKSIEEIQNGSDSDLSIRFEGGSGLYVDDNGNIVAADEDGNETQLT